MDEAVTDALQIFLDKGVLGAVLVLVLFIFGYREIKYWPGQIATLKGEAQAALKELKETAEERLNEMKAEVDRVHAGHEKTRDSLLAEVRTGGEMLRLIRETHEAQREATRSISELIREFFKKARSTTTRKRRT